MRKYIYISIIFVIVALGVHSQEVMPDGIVLKKDTLQNTLKSVWLGEVDSCAYVGQYKKIEIGLQLPVKIEEKIRAFIEKKSRTDILNPFDPKEVNIEAVFYYKEGDEWIKENTRYGFYFQDFVRDTSAVNARKWTWVEKPSLFMFKLRHTVGIIGDWKCIIRLSTSEGEMYQALHQIKFQCRKSEEKGFVKISPNKHYYQSGEDLFFPVGQNVPFPTIYTKSVAKEAWSSEVAGPAAHLHYLKDIEKLKNNGANAFRMIIAPWTYEIEFEELGNYSQRMPQAWELDQLLNHISAIDIKMLMVMQLQTVIENPSVYSILFWDWPISKKHRNSDKGYCYHTALGIEKPEDMMVNKNAIRFYKNRLRYIYSRWGYSTSIYNYSLISEINNIGQGKNANRKIYQPYNKEQEVTQKVYYWQKTMSDYIKKELHFEDQLLATSYTGYPKYPIWNEDNSMSDSCFDVVDYNWHTNYSERFLQMQKNVQRVRFENQKRNNDKPITFGEISEANAYLCNQNVEWKKNAWISAFYGLAGTGFNWNNDHNYQLWPLYGVINDFFKEIPLHQGKWESFYDVAVNNLAETFYLKQENQQMVCGIIVNRSYNMAAFSNGNPCDSIHKRYPYIKEPQDVYPKKRMNRLEVRGMKKSCKYEIEWTNALSGEVIKKEVIKSKRNAIIALNYPALIIEESPLIVYKIKEKL